MYLSRKSVTTWRGSPLDARQHEVERLTAIFAAVIFHLHPDRVACELSGVAAFRRADVERQMRSGDRSARHGKLVAERQDAPLQRWSVHVNLKYRFDELAAAARHLAGPRAVDRS